MDSHLSFVGRQFARLLATERDQDAALRRIEQTTHPSFKRALTTLRSALSSPDLDLRGDPQADAPRLAARLVRHLSERGAAPSDSVWTVIERQQLTLSVSLRTAAAEFASTLFLSLATALIACIVGLVYVVFVLPQFAHFYASVDAELPRLTSIVLASSSVWSIAVPCLILLLVGFAIAARVSSGSLGPSNTLSLLSRWSPLGRDIAQRYRLLMFLIYARGLVASGVVDSSALKAAAREVGLDPAQEQIGGTASLGSDPGSLTMYSLASADSIGFLSQEVDAQWALQNAELIAAVERRQSRVNIAVRTLLYVGVGTLVIAMYLPIFKLGAAF